MKQRERERESERERITSHTNKHTDIQKITKCSERLWGKDVMQKNFKYMKPNPNISLKFQLKYRVRQKSRRILVSQEWLEGERSNVGYR